jgi:hypothetical protein
VSDLASRFEELCANVLGPLVLGGEIHPVRPIGARLALQLGGAASVIDPDLRSRIDVARVRRARLLAPVDVVEEIDAPQVALLCALNDLLQLTNHNLAGPFTKGRAARLLANVIATCNETLAPTSIADVLSRHATFARALDLARVDSTVSWWTGSAKFRGSKPPGRLLAWREFRRVHVDETRVPLPAMWGGLSWLDPAAYDEVLALWLSRSPLTDIATAARREPRFGWSASTLSLVATPPGRSLAYRALARQPAELVAPALTAAAKAIPEAYEEARHVAEAFTSEVAAGLRLARDPSGYDRGASSG